MCGPANSRQLVQPIDEASRSTWPRHGLQYIYFAGADQGEIFSVIAQLENSIQKIRLGSNWWGQGPDLVGKFYFMVNLRRGPAPGAPDEDVIMLLLTMWW